jgi:hypothetical protein
MFVCLSNIRCEFADIRQLGSACGFASRDAGCGCERNIYAQKLTYSKNAILSNPSPGMEI